MDKKKRKQVTKRKRRQADKKKKTDRQLRKIIDGYDNLWLLISNHKKQNG